MLYRVSEASCFIHIGQSNFTSTPSSARFFLCTILITIRCRAILAQAAEARSREAILPPRDTEPVAEANSTNNSRPAAAPKMVNGPRTVSPATHNGSVVTCDPPTNLKPANSAASVRGGQPNKGPSVEKGGANPAAYPLSPPMSGATPYSSRGSAAAPVHRAPPPANGYHGGGYERPRSARDHTVASRSMPPTGVEVLEVR